MAVALGAFGQVHEAIAKLREKSPGDALLFSLFDAAIAAREKTIAGELGTVQREQARR